MDDVVLGLADGDVTDFLKMFCLAWQIVSLLASCLAYQMVSVMTWQLSGGFS